MRVDDRSPAASSIRVFGADRLEELQRIDDAVAREGVDHDLLLVARRHFLGARVVIEHALVVIDRVLDQRQLEVQARLIDQALDLAELQDEHLLALVDGEHRRQADDDDEQDEDADAEAGAAHHWPPAPWVEGVALVPRGASGSSGR